MSVHDSNAPENTAAAALAAARVALAEAESRYRATLPPGTIWPAVDDVLSVPNVRPISFDRFCEGLLTLYAPSLRAVATRRSMVHAVGVLKAVGVTMTSDLTVSLIARLIASRDPAASPNTVLGLLRRCQVICAYAVETHVLARSPFSQRPLHSWVRKRAVSGVDRHLSRVQVRALLDLLDADVQSKTGYAQWRSRRIAALVYLVALTGLRKREALTLQVSDIDLVAGLISVTDRHGVGRTKTFGSAQGVPIPPSLKGPLEDWLSHRLDAAPNITREGNVWVFPCTQKNAPFLGGSRGAKPLDFLRAAGKRLGIDVTFQRLRRTTATMLSSHTSQTLVTRILRHSSSDVTREFYQCHDAAEMAAAVKDFCY
jgi:integrase